MAKVKYDVRGVERGSDFDSPLPVGLYTCKVSECESTTSKSSGNPMIAVTYEVIHPKEHKGRLIWDYIVLDDSSEWKLGQFIDAMGLKESGSLDTNALIGNKVQVRVKHQSDKEYGTRHKAGSVIQMPEDGEDDLDDDDDAEDDAAEEQPDDDAGDDDELSYEDLEEYDREDLEAVVEENELDVKFNKRTSDDTLRERIAEELELEPEGDDDDDDDEAPDYDSMSPADLKATLKERGLKTSGPKPTLIKRLKKDDEDDGEPF